MVAKSRCISEPSDDGAHVPSAAPDLNLAEYAQGYLRKLLYEFCGGSWSGSATRKMEMMTAVVNTLNSNKKYWKSLYAMPRLGVPRCSCSKGWSHILAITGMVKVNHLHFWLLSVRHIDIPYWELVRRCICHFVTTVWGFVFGECD